MDNTENLSASEVQLASEAHSLSSNKLCPLEDNLNVGSTSSENKLETDESGESEDEEKLKQMVYEERKRAQRENKKFKKTIEKMQKEVEKIVADEEKRSQRFRQRLESANNYRKRLLKGRKIPIMRMVKLIKKP